MENRIDRKDDESLYQPKIHSERIRSLYQIKRATGKPMTVLLDEAIREFAASYGTQSPLEDVKILQNVDQDTWEEICEYRRFLDDLEYQKCLGELEINKKPIKESDLSCTFCGPGTWAVWEVVTEDGVFFVCDRHHVAMSEANIIQHERMIRKIVWV
jgi:hypothetical protein